jgi:hypothetical protein
MRLPALLIAAATLSGCAAAGGTPAADRDDRAARELAAVTEGRVAGEPQRCIDPRRVNGPQIISPNTLVYRDIGTIYTMEASGCPYIDDNYVVVAEVNGTDFCENDRFRTLQRGAVVPGAICRVGKFTPWKKPAS